MLFWWCGECRRTPGLLGGGWAGCLALEKNLEMLCCCIWLEPGGLVFFFVVVGWVEGGRGPLNR